MKICKKNEKNGLLGLALVMMAIFFSGAASQACCWGGEDVSIQNGQSPPDQTIKSAVPAFCQSSSSKTQGELHTYLKGSVSAQSIEAYFKLLKITELGPDGDIECISSLKGAN